MKKREKGNAQAYTLVEILLLLSLVGIFATVGLGILGRNTNAQNVANAFQAYLNCLDEQTRCEPDRDYYLLLGNSRGDEALTEVVLLHREGEIFSVTDLCFDLQEDGFFVRPDATDFPVQQRSFFGSETPQDVPGFPGKWYLIPWKNGTATDGRTQFVLALDHRGKLGLHRYSFSSNGTLLYKKI